VIRRANATTLATFTIDGFVAGSWTRDGRRVRIEPFAPVPRRYRWELETERERLEAFWRS
jgi:hypothetical protein